MSSKKTPEGRFYSPAIKAITTERLNAYYQGRKTIEHDSQWEDGELAEYAMYWLCPEQYTIYLKDGGGNEKKFPSEHFKPIPFPVDDDSRIRNLTIAGALIAAEIDRLIFKE